jgi:hypothetical protein
MNEFAGTNGLPVLRGVLAEIRRKDSLVVAARDGSRISSRAKVFLALSLDFGVKKTKDGRRSEEKPQKCQIFHGGK